MYCPRYAIPVTRSPVQSLLFNEFTYPPYAAVLLLYSIALVMTGYLCENGGCERALTEVQASWQWWVLVAMYDCRLRYRRGPQIIRRAEKFDFKESILSDLQ